MKPISEVTGRRLVWRQAKADSFELRCGDDVIVALDWKQPCGLVATAESVEACWVLKCAHFLESRFTIRQAGQNRDIATFSPHRASGVLKFEDGRTFLWEQVTRKQGRFAWRSEWTWKDAQGRLLVTHQPQPQNWFEGSQGEAEVIVEPGIESVAGLSLLIAMGWYMVIVRHEDEEAVMAAVLAGVAAGAV